MIHLDKDDKIGIGLILLGIGFIFAGTYWTPFVALGIILLLLGCFIWNPIETLIP